MNDLHDVSSQRSRRWLMGAVVGSAMIVVAMVTVALVLVDKPHFGWLAGSMFLMVISSGVMVGALIVLISAWMLPERKRWQGVTLMIWALIALTSPAFGFMFLFPWGVLAVMLPLIIAALVTLLRRGAPRAAAAV